MIRRGLFGLAIAGLLGTFVLGHEAVSYFRAGCRNVRNAVKAEVPIEFEMERARTMVDQLVPDIRQCMHVVAEQQVDIEHLPEYPCSERRRSGQAERSDPGATGLIWAAAKVPSSTPSFVYGRGRQT